MGLDHDVHGLFDGDGDKLLVAIDPTGGIEVGLLLVAKLVEREDGGVLVLGGLGFLGGEVEGVDEEDDDEQKHGCGEPHDEEQWHVEVGFGGRCGGHMK